MLIVPGDITRMAEHNDNRWFIDSWQHLMGGLDAMMHDVRDNVGALPTPSERLGELLQEAETERTAVEHMLQDLQARRARWSTTLDALQRELAAAGLPLRGEIT
jgi:hypothetical protein